MPAPLLDGVMQVAVTVRDLDPAIAFFRDTLGMRFLFRTDTMAFLQTGDVRVLVGTENASAQGVFLYFRVADVQEAAARLAKEGVAFEEPPRLVAKLPDRDVWLAAFRDPAGNLHHVMGEVPRGGREGA